MKFAKAFARELPRGAAWRAHAVAYAPLKRLVKQCAGLSPQAKLRAETLAQCRALAGHAPRTDAALQASPAETAFFRALRGEIQKVNRFFLHQQHVCGSRVQRFVSDIENETRAIGRHGAGHAPGTGHWLQRAQRVYQELLALEWFCVLNFCAVSKILKKHDKWTRYDTRVRFEHAVLVRQPFATYVPLLQMMRRVEAIAWSVSMAEGWLLPMEPLAGMPSVESRKRALPRRYASDTEDDTDVTDSEGMRTPRHPADYDSSSSEVLENHRPRQRQRQV